MKRAVAITAIVCLAFLGGAAWATNHEPNRIAFLARADNPVDALSASSVAAQFGGIVLLTPSDHLGQDARQGLDNYRPDLVILAGGEGALSAKVEQDTQAAGYQTRRVGGLNRLETSRNIANVLAEYQTDLRSILSGAMFMYPAQTECPDGMTPVDGLNAGAFPRGGTSAASGGTPFHTHGVSSHSHSIPSHSHDFFATTDYGDDTTFGGAFFNPQYNDDGSGGESWHDHAVSGTTSNTSLFTSNDGSGSTQLADNLPPYVNVRFCQFTG